MKKLLSLILLSTSALATENLNLKYGFGIWQSGRSYYVDLDYQKPFYHSLNYLYACGSWIDQSGNVNQSSSMFCHGSLGVKVELTKHYFESMHGVGFISNADRLLGGNFQFFHDVGFGVKDLYGFSLGLGFKHASSAGIEKPNIGRNFLLIKVGYPL